MRASGIFVDPKDQSPEVPFGVRAIESGIEVDGIWISSKGAQPLPARLKATRTPNAAESISSTESDQSSLPRGRQSMPRSTSSNSAFDKVVGAEAFSSTDSLPSQNLHPGYKPRRSSHLRYSSYTKGQFDQDTLGALEGNPGPEKHPARKFAKNKFETSTSIGSTADNERSSDSESEGTLSHFNSTADDSMNSGLPRRRTQQDTGDYFSVPAEETSCEKTNPFVTPNQSPPNPSMISNDRVMTDSERPLLSYQESSPTRFGAPETRRSVGKVNSGFEVLPAGTFPTLKDVKGKGVDREKPQETPEKEKRWSSKLTKKARNLMSMNRISKLP